MFGIVIPDANTLYGWLIALGLFGYVCAAVLVWEYMNNPGLRIRLQKRLPRAKNWGHLMVASRGHRLISHIANFDDDDAEYDEKTWLLPKGLMKAREKVAVEKGIEPDYNIDVYDDNGVPTIFYSYKDAAKPISLEVPNLAFSERARDPAMVSAFIKLVKARAMAGAFNDALNRLQLIAIGAGFCALAAAWFAYNNGQSLSGLLTAVNGVVPAIKAAIPTVIR